ncbi:MAG: autotransporter-associated beta strand repeat-containing protein [Phycisphaeraceae bacterium]
MLAVTAALLGLVTPAHAGWTQTGAGPFDYNDTGNWAGGTIDGLWDSSLTLAAGQTATFGADTVLGTGWTFNYAGNFGLTLRGTGADRTVTLGGNVGLNTGGGTSANVAIGSTTAGQRLHVDLGGATRTFDIAASRALTLSNNVVGTGGVTKTGAGELKLISAANTFTGDISVTGGTLALGSDASMADSILGNAANNLSLTNATLRFGTANSRSFVFNPRRTINISGNVSFIGPSGYSNNYADLNVSGSIVGSGNLTIGSSGSTLLSGNNTGINLITLNTILRVSSEANLGNNPNSAFTGTGFSAKGFSIMGTALNNLSGHTFPWVTNQGITWDIQDPNNTFTWDKNFNIGMNAGTSPGTFFKNGLGTLVVTAAQTYNNIQAGAPDTVMNGGVLKVDYTAGGNLPSAADGNQLAFGGGTLYLLGKNDDAVNQNMKNVKLLAGGGSLVVDNQSGSSTTTANLGDFTTIAAPAAGSSLNIRTINPGSGAAVVTSTATNDASGVLSAGRIVYNGTDWASIVSGTTVGAYSGYTALPAGFSGDGSATNYSAAGNATVTDNGAVNTLKLTTTTSGQSLAITDTKTLTFSSGGLLFAGANDYAITGGTLAGGQATVSEVLIQQYGAGVLTIGSVIANGNGASVLTIAGTGKVVLTSANTYTGVTYVEGAVLSISVNNQLNNGANTALNLYAGTLQTTETITTGRAVGLGGGGGTFDVADTKTLTINGNVTGGRLTLANSDAGNGTLVLGGSGNAFASGVVINGGILRLNHNNALGTMGFNTLSFGSATTEMLQINGARTITVAGLTSASANAVVENGATGAAVLRVYNGGDNTFAGVLRDGAAGTLAFEKGGGAKLILTGANTYTGDTTVNNGSLLVNGSITNSAVTVNAGTLGGTGSIGGAVAVNAGGTLAPGASAGTLTIDNSLTLAGTALFELDSAASYDKALVNTITDAGVTLGFGGMLTVVDNGVSFAGGQVFDLFDWGGNTTIAGTFSTITLPTLAGNLQWKDFGGPSFDYATGQIVVEVIPEPATLVLMGLGGLLLLPRRGKATR